MKTMKQAILTIAAAAAIAAATACGKNETFTVEANIDGVGTQNLTAIWRTAPDGHLGVAAITAVGNSFSFTGSTPEPALVEIYTAQGAPLLRFMADGGDKVRLRGPGHDLRVTGSDIGVHFAEVLNRVNEEPDRAAAIATYVAANPADRAAAALLIGEFDARGRERLADSLLGLLDSVAAPAWLTADWAASVRRSAAAGADTIAEFNAFISKADTFVTLSGRHIYVLTENETQRPASLIDSLRAWTRDADSLTVVDIYFGADRAVWRAITESDSATWTQVILPGGAAAPAFLPLQIRHTPMLLETDSAGVITRRLSL